MPETKKKATASLYNKNQIVNSKKFEKYRDFLAGNLEISKLYTMEQVEELIKSFYGRSDGIRWWNIYHAE